LLRSRARRYAEGLLKRKKKIIVNSASINALGRTRELESGRALHEILQPHPMQVEREALRFRQRIANIGQETRPLPLTDSAQVLRHNIQAILRRNLFEGNIRPQRNNSGVALIPRKLKRGRLVCDTLTQTYAG